MIEVTTLPAAYQMATVRRRTVDASSRWGFAFVTRLVGGRERPDFAPVSSTLTPRPAAESADPRPAPLTAERYVQLLYARLAWEATLRLGDPSTAGRLVERVLHRAWRERERFAAGEALLRHATESAEAAIAREEARRLSVTRFDPDEAAVGLPGDLTPLSPTAVAERIRSGRAPMATPPAGAATVSGGSAAPAAAVTPPAHHAGGTHNGTSPETPLHVDEPMPRDGTTDTFTAMHATPHTGTHASTQTAEHRRAGRASWATPHAAGAATANVAGAATAHTASAPAPRAGTAEHPRPHLRSASYIAKPSTRRFTPRLMALAAGGVLVAAVAIWRLTAGPSGIVAARAAAADSTAPLFTTGRGERRDSTLATGLLASLGPSSSVSVPAALAAGIRGVTVGGHVSLEAAVDSARPVVVRARGQQLELVGGRVNVATFGDSVFAFAESGDVVHRGAAATRIAAGQTVLIGPDGSVQGVSGDDAARRFAWRSGRLRTPRGPVRSLREPLGTWFGIDLVSDLTDSVALDIALDSSAALPAVIGASAPGLAATLEGTRLTIAKAAPTTRPSRPRAVAPPEDIAPPVLRRLPGIPPEPPLD